VEPHPDCGMDDDGTNRTSSLMVGYGAHRRGALLLVLPIVVSIAFLLIADIDSPRGGIIRVLPQNLISLSQSMKAQ
jgi:hypothetical protein